MKKKDKNGQTINGGDVLKNQFGICANVYYEPKKKEYLARLQVGQSFKGDCRKFNGYKVWTEKDFNKLEIV